MTAPAIQYSTLVRDRAREKKRDRGRALYAVKKNDEEFRQQRRESDKRWRDANKDKVKARNKRWQEANRDVASAASSAWRQKNAHVDRRKRYGTSQAEWEAMFAAQGSACAVCKSTSPGKQPWHTDHDHETGLVRGILCFRCNIALGMLGDDLESVTRMTQNLVSYLSRSG
jgi:hypothetical protein